MQFGGLVHLCVSTEEENADAYLSMVIIDCQSEGEYLLDLFQACLVSMTWDRTGEARLPGDA